MNISGKFAKAATHIAGAYATLTVAAPLVSACGVALTDRIFPTDLMRTLEPIFTTALKLSTANVGVAVGATAIGTAGYLAYQGYKELTRPDSPVSAAPVAAPV